MEVSDHEPAKCRTEDEELECAKQLVLLGEDTEERALKRKRDTGIPRDAVEQCQFTRRSMMSVCFWETYIAEEKEQPTVEQVLKVQNPDDKIVTLANKYFDMCTKNAFPGRERDVGLVAVEMRNVVSGKFDASKWCTTPKRAATVKNAFNQMLRRVGVHEVPEALSRSKRGCLYMAYELNVNLPVLYDTAFSPHLDIRSMPPELKVNKRGRGSSSAKYNPMDIKNLLD